MNKLGKRKLHRNIVLKSRNYGMTQLVAHMCHLQALGLYHPKNRKPRGNRIYS